jgi:hypothetical protein
MRVRWLAAVAVLMALVVLGLYVGPVVYQAATSDTEVSLLTETMAYDYATEYERHDAKHDQVDHGRMMVYEISGRWWSRKVCAVHVYEERSSMQCW